MTADYELKLTMEGSMDELRSMLEVVGFYTGDRPQWFSSIMVEGREIDLKNLTDTLVKEVSASGKVNVTAYGPWGHYGELNDVGLFREMAEAAPEASFIAEISGFGQYEVQNLKCELKQRLLNITTYFESNDAGTEAWAEDFVKKLPYDKFKTLFKISGKDLDDVSYEYLAKELNEVFYEGFEYADYDSFVSSVEMYDRETELDEDEFREIVTNKLSPLGIIGGYEFKEYNELGETDKYVYDPVKKEYVGKSRPLFGGGQIINANDLIAAGLQAQGLPSDANAIASLSLEDAYAAIGAALGSEDQDEEDEDSD